MRRRQPVFSATFPVLRDESGDVINSTVKISVGTDPKPNLPGLDGPVARKPSVK